MTSSTMLAQGKYRQRKDWSTNSIPTLVALEEEGSSSCEGETLQSRPPKPPRRSSIAIGLPSGRVFGAQQFSNNQLPEKHTKRRSSIAVAFLGRHHKVRSNIIQTVSSACIYIFFVYIYFEPFLICFLFLCLFFFCGPMVLCSDALRSNYIPNLMLVVRACVCVAQVEQGRLIRELGD